MAQAFFDQSGESNTLLSGFSLDPTQEFRRQPDGRSFDRTHMLEN
jgi:hypothetical protein